MNKVLVNKKEFNVLERLGEKSLKVERKGKVFFYKSFEGDKSAFEDYLYAKKHIACTGIGTAKIILKDKKSLSVITEFIEGETVLDALLKGPLDEKYFDLIFKATFYIKMENMNLDYSPNHWVLSNGKLYYLETIMMTYKEEESFTKRYIYLWFYTNEFIKFLNEKGIDHSHIKLKPEYEINKEIVLMTCKYYR